MLIVLHVMEKGEHEVVEIEDEDDKVVEDQIEDGAAD